MCFPVAVSLLGGILDTKWQLELQVGFLKEFADLQHKDLDCILLGCNHSDNSEQDELIVPETRTSILKEEDESCTIDKDNSVIKKMENIYKQAKVYVYM